MRGAKRKKRNIKPSEPPRASRKAINEVIELITENLPSCIQMQENIREEIRFLHNHPELSYAKRDIKALKKFLVIASFSEGILKIDPNINVKKLLDSIANEKSPGTVEDKIRRGLEIKPNLQENRILP